MAGHAPMQREMPQQPATSIFGGSAAPVAAAPVINAPAWFNEQSFRRRARAFPLAAAALGRQRWTRSPSSSRRSCWASSSRSAEIGDAYQSTYIDDLQIQLDGVDDDAEKTTATLTFTGVAKTSRFDQGEPFSESWRMERTQGENQPWLVAGIRQNA